MSTQRHRIEPGNSIVPPRAWLLGVAVWLLVVSMFLALETRAKDNKAEGRQDPVEQLAAKLGDESFTVREHAMEELWKLGQKALPALRQIEASDDIEASERAKELIQYISAGLLFDSPEEVKEMVLGFFQSNDNGKIIIAHKLMKLGEWRQVMSLARLEKRTELRNSLAKIAWKEVKPIMLTAIADSDQVLVEEILMLSGDIEFYMPVRAFYHCHRGKLQEQLGQAAAMEEERAATWKMWLYRASGNIEAAIKEAQKANKPDEALLLRVLTGDAKPWLERSSSEGDSITQWGAELQQLRLEGKEDEAAALSQQWKQIVADRPVADRVIRCLAANGFREEALTLLQNSDQGAAFAFFNIIEMPEHSLKQLGIGENAKPPYTQWVNERIKNLEDKLDDDETIEQLFNLSAFLHERGEYDHARDVLAPMMKLLVKEKQDEERQSAWAEQITYMLAYGQGAMAVHFAKQRISQNELDDEAVFEIGKTLVSIWSPSSEHLDCLWAQLERRNAEDISKTLDEIGLLAGLLPDPQEQVNQIHDELMKEAHKQDQRLKQQMITMLYELCLQRNDINKASLMLDAHAALIEDSTADKMDIDYQLMRWERVEPVLEALVRDDPYDASNLMKCYIALSKLGKAEKAEQVYKQALLNTLGESRSLIVFGFYLLDAGYQEKAVELWLLAAAMSDLDGADNILGERNKLNALSDYKRAIASLANYGQALHHSKDWQRAAAISEVYARSVMSMESPAGLHTCLRARYQAEFCRGMLMLQQGRKPEALRRLKIAQRLVRGDGVLADDFFPTIKNKIPADTYDRWFDENYSHIQAACEKFPNSHNAHNTAAWLAARAIKNLDEAHAHAKKAVSMRPSQGAYLDTMAEVWFARGERNKAMEWSKKAIAASISNAQGSPRSLEMVYANFRELNKQYDHFKNDPLPNKAR